MSGRALGRPLQLGVLLVVLVATALLLSLGPAPAPGSRSRNALVLSDCVTVGTGNNFSGNLAISVSMYVAGSLCWGGSNVSMREPAGPGQTLTLYVGKKFKVTRERIRQLEYLALAKIRRQMQSHNKIRTADEVEEERHAAERAETIREFVSKNAIAVS